MADQNPPNPPVPPAPLADANAAPIDLAQLQQLITAQQAMIGNLQQQVQQLLQQPAPPADAQPDPDPLESNNPINRDSRQGCALYKESITPLPEDQRWDGRPEKLAPFVTANMLHAHKWRYDDPGAKGIITIRDNSDPANPRDLNLFSDYHSITVEMAG